MQGRMEAMPERELRDTITRLASALHNAKTTAAHYKLQHQMSQMESGEAVERMAVEMEMASREIEVLQQAETHRRIQQYSRDTAPVEQTNFRQVHNDIFDAMCDEIRDLKTQNTQLEQELGHSRKILAHQEEEIASLNDKVSLMRDRIRESREQLLRYRKQGAADSTPRANKVMTPFQTPSRDRFVSSETPRGPQQPQLPPYQPPPPLHHQPAHQSQQQQPGFAALLQATDIISQGGRAPSDDHRRGHSRNSQSMSSLPTTPSRPAKFNPHALYTPQPPRHIPLEVPKTAPVPRKRQRETMTPPPSQSRGYDSDGTVSAVDDDSEAETEVAEDATDIGDGQSRSSAEQRTSGPVVKRAKSAYDVKGMTQTRLFGQVRKSNIDRDENNMRKSVEKAQGENIRSQLGQHA
ncbi:hypothetical protein ANO11243_061330 [Dothideomycetidae sp. 11243]|nr:hypothetical protein ANO11243_061330 [fungal sp. No.11243]